MTLTFHYKEVRRPDKTTVKVPAIPIVLLGDAHFETLALLDSGADISVIPESVAELLGINLGGEKTQAYGIGGVVDAIETRIALRIEKGHERYQFQIPMKIILGEYDFPILLGKAGFFEKFVVSFDQDQEKVSLKWKGRRSY